MSYKGRSAIYFALKSLFLSVKIKKDFFMKGGVIFLSRILFFTFFFILLLSVGSFAAMIVDVEVNSEKIAFDVAPEIKSDTVYVPVRLISEALGLDCGWVSESSSADIEGSGVHLTLYPENNSAYLNGKRKSVKSYIKDGRLMAPARFISESFGAKIDWDQTFYRVLITKNGVNVPESLLDSSYNQDEVYWLSKIIHAESVGEIMPGQIAVGNVVLNRVESKDFPNTIYSVIFDKAGGVQFEPVINGTIHLTPSHSAVEAAKRALMGENTAGNSLFFLNPKKAQSFWIVNNRPFFASIGNHDFYL